MFVMPVFEDSGNSMFVSLFFLFCVVGSTSLDFMHIHIKRCLLTGSNARKNAEIMWTITVNVFTLSDRFPQKLETYQSYLVYH